VRLTCVFNKLMMMMMMMMMILFYIAVNKEYLTKIRIIFRYVNSAFAQAILSEISI